MILAIATIVPLLLTIAFYTIGERKAMGAIQRRKGPNVVGFWGLLQPIADGLKLIIKEIIIPRKSDTPIYLIAPLLTFWLSLLNWAVVPFNLGNCFADINLGVLYLLALSGLGLYGVILSGWASNSKYSLLGGLRAAAQMISYEISISLCILPVIILTGSLNLTNIVFFQTNYGWNIFILFPIALMLFISILAETNRAPFDLPEAEAEIVAGYNLEYSGFLFAMFFLGEYGNMILMSALMVILFFGGWSSFLLWDFIFGELVFAIKTVAIAFLFILVRAILPRYRFDQLMQIGWKVILPLGLGFLTFFSSILFGFNIVPINNLVL
jgi:NADH-quinone oxidoreductase subunit H